MRQMRWVMKKYYEYKIPVDAVVNSTVTFSAFSTILNAAIDSNYPWKTYVQWGVAAGMTVGSAAATILYYRGKQPNIVHVDSLNEVGKDLDALALRLTKKFRSRRKAMLKINGLLAHIPENVRPHELTQLLTELHRPMQAHEQHLTMLQQNLSRFRPKIKPLMIASGVAEGLGYSLLLCSAYDLIRGEAHLLDLPLIIVSSALFLAGAAWNIFKEYHYEKSRKFIENYGSISQQISQINIDSKMCEDIIQNALSHLSHFFSALELEQKSPQEIYALYLPLIQSIQGSGYLGRGDLKKSFISENPAELTQYFSHLAQEYVAHKKFFRDLAPSTFTEVVVDTDTQQSQFQLLQEGDNALLPISGPNFSINDGYENTALLHPEIRRESRSISKALFLLYKIPEGGYPLLAWLTLVKVNLWIAGSAGAALGLAFAGLKYARCEQFETLLRFNSKALSDVNDGLKSLNSETVFSENDLDKKISEILDLYFSAENLAHLAKSLRSSESLDSALRPRSNRQQFWQQFREGEFQLEEITVMRNEEKILAP